ncbi:MAG: TonB-dependent receptor, partial [Candidatus Eremiobacteraeota bacterium]|nr:TonB-dependent receptor [Candidatus Eremiobacteraeota bacterium]
SYVLNQEPQFSAELRTTFHGDTILLRPYQAQIKRFIDGSLENTTPGYGAAPKGTAQGWYQVTNTANCQVIFAAPTAAGAKGPCFSAADNYQTPYVGAPVAGTPTLFATSATAPNCAPPNPPCYTTATNFQRNGVYGYNTPFSQPEIDRTHGVTFSYIHPNHDNLYSFNVDYNSDNTLKYSGDTSPLPAGCVPTVGTAPNAPTYIDVAGVAQPNPYYQPACKNAGLAFGASPTALPGTPGTFGFTARNSLQIPPTTNYRTDYSLTALLQVTKKLQLGIGNYLTVQKLDTQMTDPAAAAAAANLDFDPITHKPTGRFNGAEPSDASLIHNVVMHTHYDPHFQAQYRMNSDISLRANAGSSVTMPYAGVTSGFTSLSINSGPDGKSDTLSVKNPQLLPEVTVAYNVGFDARLRNGMLVSADAFNNTIHNVFVSYSQLIPNLPGRNPSQTIQTTTINGPLERNYGIELTVQKSPAVGVGFYATATAQRAYYDGFGLDFYKGIASFAPPGKQPGFVGLVNGKQLDASTSFTGQVPYFKAKAEINWMMPHQRAYVALGEVLNGNNNPYGVGAFSTFYANGTLDLGHNLAFRVAGENIFNTNLGGVNGNNLYGLGITPIGVRYNTVLKALEYGAAFGGPNNVTIVKPPNFYFTLSKKI